ncbi:MAG: hypothetical protein LBC12_00585 [Nitrososphaerota archaeon]|nr:hypothetical protein [Nitrososphaerota archaeon]
MNEKEKQQQQQNCPVKTTHEFLSEINKEWCCFKRGAIMSIIVCSLLIVSFVSAFLRITKTHGFEVSELFLVLPIAGFLIYTIYLMISQYRFFRQWKNAWNTFTVTKKNCSQTTKITITKTTKKPKQARNNTK